MKALRDLGQSGKVRYTGASSVLCCQFAYVNDVASKDGWNQARQHADKYSLLYREEMGSPFTDRFDIDQFHVGTRGAGLLYIQRDQCPSGASHCGRCRPPPLAQSPLE